MLECEPRRKPEKFAIATPFEAVVKKDGARVGFSLDVMNCPPDEEPSFVIEAAKKLAETVGASSHEIVSSSSRAAKTFGFFNWNGSKWQPEGIFRRHDSSIDEKSDKIPPPSSLHPELN